VLTVVAAAVGATVAILSQDADSDEAAFVQGEAPGAPNDAATADGRPELPSGVAGELALSPDVEEGRPSETSPDTEGGDSTLAFAAAGDSSVGGALTSPATDDETETSPASNAGLDGDPDRTVDAAVDGSPEVDLPAGDSAADDPSAVIDVEALGFGPFAAVVDALNNQLLLLRNIDVVFQECGTINAFYDPESGAIAMCYEIVDWLAQSFAQVEDDPDVVFARGLDAAIFILNHEVGHALVHQLELPTTGKEEDAVDEQASIILLESFPGGEAAVLNAAQSFFISGNEVTDLSELDFADEHSLDAQRFFAISCLVFGSNSVAHASLVEDGTLGEERAALCE